jgi:dTDP-4-amino-4,6-dideoxygalactose transaminase
MRPRYYHQAIGINSRLDTLQAAVLGIKLRKLGDYTRARQANAQRYNELLSMPVLAGAFGLPYRDPAANHVWNQYGIRVHGGQRDALKNHLQQRGIGCEVYYPVPLHQQQCFKHCGYADGSLPETEAAAREILHLPIYPELKLEEQERVVDAIVEYYQHAYVRKAA